jgi:hypothetical protein
MCIYVRVLHFPIFEIVYQEVCQEYTILIDTNKLPYDTAQVSNRDRDRFSSSNYSVCCTDVLHRIIIIIIIINAISTLFFYTD